LGGNTLWLLSQDELRDAVLLVFANKQDLPNAMNAAEITDKLGLHSLRQRHWCVCSPPLVCISLIVSKHLQHYQLCVRLFSNHCVHDLCFISPSLLYNGLPLLGFLASNAAAQC
jgi:hypothetical protein